MSLHAARLHNRHIRDSVIVGAAREQLGLVRLSEQPGNSTGSESPRNYKLATQILVGTPIDPGVHQLRCSASASVSGSASSTL